VGLSSIISPFFGHHPIPGQSPRPVVDAEAKGGACGRDGKPESSELQGFRSAGAKPIKLLTHNFRCVCLDIMTSGWVS